ncbi:MAG: YkvA family protein [Phocaeicola sp.]
MDYRLLNSDYLLEKLQRYATQLGRVTLRPALLLYFVMRGEKTPSKDKWSIALALAYLVLPIDLLPAKKAPIVGWLDEAASLLFLFYQMRKHITPEMERKVEQLLDKWLPEYTHFESVEE